MLITSTADVRSYTVHKKVLRMITRSDRIHPVAVRNCTAPVELCKIPWSRLFEVILNFTDDFTIFEQDTLDYINHLMEVANHSVNFSRFLIYY